MKKHNIYYAHSMRIYNTGKEHKELRFLNKKFNVFNPKTEITWNPILRIAPYLIAVKNSDIIICSEYKNHVGKGVYEEIKIALQFNIPSFCLEKRRFRFKLRKITGLEIINPKDWKINYAKLLKNDYN